MYTCTSVCLGKTLVSYNQTLTFQHSLFVHFIQESTEIWYPGNQLMLLPDIIFSWLPV